MNPVENESQAKPVTISTLTPESEQEALPEEYDDRRKRVLDAIVEGGSNTINFDLKSE